MRDRIDRLQTNLERVIVGKAEAIQWVLVALLAGGHALLEDVPGVGKTLLAKSLARSIDGKFQRIQCTPDLLPADVTGTNIWNPQTGAFEFLPGPVFANVLLADEINRATPRTQSSLLEVMEERQVTTDGVSRPVPNPFFTIATQNPIEYQGTFPLPEAQMDRFTLAFSLGYPDEAGELQMLQRHASGQMDEPVQPCVSLDEMLALRQAVATVRVAEVVQTYILAIVRATRESEDIALGVSPRGAVALQRATQALAFLRDRDYGTPDDVKDLVPQVLAHRMIAAGGKHPKHVLAHLLDQLPVP